MAKRQFIDTAEMRVADRRRRTCERNLVRSIRHGFTSFFARRCLPEPCVSREVIDPRAWDWCAKWITHEGAVHQMRRTTGNCAGD